MNSGEGSDSLPLQYWVYRREPCLSSGVSCGCLGVMIHSFAVDCLLSHLPSATHHSVNTFSQVVLIQGWSRLTFIHISVTTIPTILCCRVALPCIQFLPHFSLDSMIISEGRYYLPDMTVNQMLNSEGREGPPTRLSGDLPGRVWGG